MFDIELMMAELMEMARHPSSIGGTVCFLSRNWENGGHPVPQVPTHKVGISFCIMYYWAESSILFDLYLYILHICYIHLLKL